MATYAFDGSYHRGLWFQMRSLKGWFGRALTSDTKDKCQNPSSFFTFWAPISLAGALFSPHQKQGEPVTLGFDYIRIMVEFLYDSVGNGCVRGIVFEVRDYVRGSPSEASCP